LSKAYWRCLSTHFLIVSNLRRSQPRLTLVLTCPNRELGSSQYIQPVVRTFHKPRDQPCFRLLFLDQVRVLKAGRVGRDFFHFATLKSLFSLHFHIIPYDSPPTYENLNLGMKCIGRSCSDSAIPPPNDNIFTQLCQLHFPLSLLFLSPFWVVPLPADLPPLSNAPETRHIDTQFKCL